MSPLPSVLVADYVDHTARLWAEGLARVGYVVHCCRPVDIRPALLQAYRPDLLILAVSRVRGAIEYEDLEGRRVPVIVVSANPNDHGRMSEYGCAAILLRPASLHSLLDTVRAVLPKRSADFAAPDRISTDRRSPGWLLRKRSRELCDVASDLRRQALDLAEISRKIAGRKSARVDAPIGRKCRNEFRHDAARED